jgi:hypothetical protein
VSKKETAVTGALPLSDRPIAMLQKVTASVMNRLVFLALLFIVVYAFARRSHFAGDNPISQIGKVVSDLNQLASAIQTHRPPF